MLKKASNTIIVVSDVSDLCPLELFVHAASTLAAADLDTDETLIAPADAPLILH
jgi:hypothetical protein